MVVYKCSNRHNSAATENGTIFFSFSQGLEEEKWLGKNCQQSRLVTKWEQYSVICSAHLLMDGTVMTQSLHAKKRFNQKKKGIGLLREVYCRWLICPLLCQHTINQERLLWTYTIYKYSNCRWDCRSSAKKIISDLWNSIYGGLYQNYLTRPYMKGHTQ